MRSKGFLSTIDILTEIDIPIRIILFDNIKHYQKVACHTKDKDIIATYYSPPTECQLPPAKAEGL